MLIELLVVIAIIAILAAILFPVFAQARESCAKVAGRGESRRYAAGRYLPSVIATLSLSTMMPTGAGAQSVAPALAPGEAPAVTAWKVETDISEEASMVYAYADFMPQYRDILMAMPLSDPIVMTVEQKPSTPALRGSMTSSATPYATTQWTYVGAYSVETYWSLWSWSDNLWGRDFRLKFKCPRPAVIQVFCYTVRAWEVYRRAASSGGQVIRREPNTFYLDLTAGAYARNYFQYYALGNAGEWANETKLRYSR